MPTTAIRISDHRGIFGLSAATLPDPDSSDDDHGRHDGSDFAMDLRRVCRTDKLAANVLNACDRERDPALDGVAEARAEPDHQDPHPDPRYPADRAGVGDREVEVEQP